ncbi:ras-related protein Rab-44-like [Notechis scutatus]|uniref:Ras-related protein Rab-44-like n=1 Tax=Notechis scutatus TaxID=8663 RepID=A0A6J1USN8_9SAUR|nr:ras-related protein Rab-44-like [Notechis scutatus]
MLCLFIDRKRKTALMKATSNLSLEEINSEEKKHFESFINQLGADNVFEDKSEIWKIWVKLWEAEPNLLGNLKEFLAKMTHLIKEAKHEKEKIQLLLKIQIPDHNKKVQKLYEEMEQQIEREKQKLQHENKARSQLHYMEMQQELDGREQDIQHSLIVQKELETQLLRLKEKQLVTSTQSQQLQQIKSSLENELQQTHHQLQKTERCLDVMKDRISQLYSEGGASDDVTSVTEADVKSSRRMISTEEDPLIEPFVDEEDYFPQESLDTISLFKELNEAIAAQNKMSEPHYQEIDGFGFQQESLDHTKYRENSQQNIMPPSPIKGCSTNYTVQNRMSEVAISEAGDRFREGSVPVQDLEMKKANFSKTRKEVKTTEPTLRETFASMIQPFVYSDLAIQASAYKKCPIESEIVVLEGVTQPEQKKKTLKYNDTIQVPQLSTEAVANQSAKMKIQDRKVSQTQQPLLKNVPSEYFLPKVALPKLHAGHNPSSHVQNMFGTGMDTELAERLEMYSSEGRREGWIGPSECKKNQEVSAEFNEETSVRTEVCDCQMNKETSKDTAILYSHPDHFYNVLFVGASNVGKTSFLNKLQNDSFEAKVTATIGIDYRIKNLILDSKCFALRLWDTAGQERYHSVTKQFFRKADGVVLMYDITSEYSFTDVRYWLNCVQEGAGAGVVVLLLGNKTDCSVERKVSVENGAYLGKVYGLPFYECSAASGYNVTESIVQLIRLMKTQEDQLKKKALDLPLQLKNKRSCCL